MQLVARFCLTSCDEVSSQLSPWMGRWVQLLLLALLLVRLLLLLLLLLLVLLLLLLLLVLLWLLVLLQLLWMLRLRLLELCRCVTISTISAASTLAVIVHAFNRCVCCCKQRPKRGARHQPPRRSKQRRN